MKTTRAAIFVLVTLLATHTAVVSAQDYAFRVPSLKLETHVNPDASVRFVYQITFENQPGAHVIDIVDVGLPHDEASPRNMSASVGNTIIRGFPPSTYVDNAIELHLGAGTILPGQTGTVRFEFTMPEMVYQDTTRDDYASLQLTPTWFGDDFTLGRSRVQVAIHLPEGIEPDEVLHQGQPFTNKAQFDDHVVVAWDFPNTRATGPHDVAVSFPKRNLDRVVHIGRFGLLVRWFEANPQYRLLAAGLFGILFAVMFFRFSGGTGWSLFLISLAGLGLLFVVSPTMQLIAFIPLVILFGINEWALARREPGTAYLPAIAQVEGGGIKRGLTAPEAAVVLELPLSKVLTLVVFGLLKKRLIEQVEAVPLQAKLSSRIPAPMADWGKKRRASHFRDAAKRLGTVVHKHELPFLEAIQANTEQLPLDELDFTAPLAELVKHAAGRLRGFDTSDTKGYYRSIVRRAVKEADTIGDLKVREKVLDSSFDWVLMDDDYPTVFGRGGHVYHPPWVRSTGGSAAAPSAPSAPSGPSARGAPSFGDVTSSFAGWTENTMGRMASAFDPAHMSFDAPRGGILNLSGADRVTGDFFEALAEASASGSGGGGGGGCACAGCACACACAGGGR